MEIKIETYGTTGVGRVIVFDKNDNVCTINFGPADAFKTEAAAAEAANAVIIKHSIIYSKP